MKPVLLLLRPLLLLLLLLDRNRTWNIRSRPILKQLAHQTKIIMRELSFIFRLLLRLLQLLTRAPPPPPPLPLRLLPPVLLPWPLIQLSIESIEASLTDELLHIWSTAAAN